MMKTAYLKLKNSSNEHFNYLLKLLAQKRVETILSVWVRYTYVSPNMQESAISEKIIFHQKQSSCSVLVLV